MTPGRPSASSALSRLPTDPVSPTAPAGPRPHPSPPDHLCGVLSLLVSGSVSDPAPIEIHLTPLHPPCVPPTLKLPRPSQHPSSPLPASRLPGFPLPDPLTAARFSYPLRLRLWFQSAPIPPPARCVSDCLFALSGVLFSLGRRRWGPDRPCASRVVHHFIQPADLFCRSRPRRGRWCAPPPIPSLLFRGLLTAGVRTFI